MSSSDVVLISSYFNFMLDKSLLTKQFNVSSIIDILLIIGTHLMRDECDLWCNLLGTMSCLFFEGPVCPFCTFCYEANLYFILDLAYI